MEGVTGRRERPALPVMRRFGRQEGLVSLVIPLLTYASVAGGIWYAMWPYFYYVKSEHFIVLGLFAVWRYGWMLTNYFRATLYTFYKYPRLKKRVSELPVDARLPSQVFFIIPSYREEPWVIQESFQSIFSNLSELDVQATIVVATGSDRDDEVIRAVYEAYPGRKKVELVLQRQEQGKRIAMGHALRALARRYDDTPDSVTIFMDGDSYLPPGTLARSLPFFVRFRSLGAATTDEVAFINTRSSLYREWFNLKFGQRHIQFKSHSLSNKVLTLTGRFSLFRTSILVEEEFIRQVENDVISHWLHGTFRFLMGDDKSTWFYLLKNRWDMLYLPDVVAYSLESRGDRFWQISLSLPYRWYGNTLRNNARALALGWRTTGLFPWLAILDQRISMWTSLVGITGAVLLSLFKSFVYLPFYIAWAVCVRLVQMTVIAWRGHPVSLLTLPLMLYNQWVGAVIKIRASFNLADQSWSKGASRQDGMPDRRPIPGRLPRLLPRVGMLVSYLAFFFFLMLSEGIWKWPSFPQAWADPTVRVVEAVEYGVIPDDGKDDARPLNRLIGLLKGGAGAVIRLPPGRLDLAQPVVIDGDGIALRGSKEGGTLLEARFPGDTAMLMVTGRKSEGRYHLLEDAADDSTVIRVAAVSGEAPLRPGEWLLLEVPNDRRFLSGLGASRWDRPYPRLRQVMLRIGGVEGDRVRLSHPPGFVLPAASTRITRLLPRRGVRLEGLRLRYVVPGGTEEGVRGRYENTRPDHVVDGIRLRWVTDCALEGIRVEMAGRHPLNLDGVAGCRFRNISLQGAWNKGPGGMGYLRVARSYFNRFDDIEVRDLRHLAIQWSSAHNRFHGVSGNVDINFHGGYSHDNRIDSVRLVMPAYHPWPPVYRTPADAHWAPPDGPGNEVHDCRYRHPEEKSWRRCDT